jgi:hypothetical protein
MGKYDLKGLRESSQEEEMETAPLPSPPSRAGVREPGKRSNPEFSRTTVYMRDSTKLKAVRLLQDRKEDRDLSDLIENLVSEWTSRHSAA